MQHSKDSQPYELFVVKQDMKGIGKDNSVPCQVGFLLICRKEKKNKKKTTSNLFLDPPPSPLKNTQRNKIQVAAPETFDFVAPSVN